MSAIIFDTSALLCYLRDEKGAADVHHFLSSKKFSLKMHRIHLGELYYGILKKDGPEIASQVYGMLLQYPVHYLSDLNDALLMTAGRLKVDYKLGFADSFAAAAAIIDNAALVTKDNDFRPLAKDGILQVVWI